MLVVGFIWGLHMSSQRKPLRHHPEFYPTATVATTGPISLHEPPTCVDREIVLPGQRILVKHQVQPEYNGMYMVRNRHHWERMDLIQSGRWVWVLKGHVFGGTLWTTQVLSTHTNREGYQAVTFKRAREALVPQPSSDESDVRVFHGDGRWCALPHDPGEYMVQHRDSEERWQLTPVYIDTHHQVYPLWDQAIVMGQKVDTTLDIQAGRWFTVRNL